MAGTNEGSLPLDKPGAGRRHHLFGAIALTLWSLAATCTALDGLVAFDRDRVLIFTADLIRMDIAGALLFSFFWFQTRKPPGIAIADVAVFTEHIWSDGYDKGYGKGREDSDDCPPDPQFVVPRQHEGPIRGYYTTPGHANDRTNGHMH